MDVGDWGYVADLMDRIERQERRERRLREELVVNDRRTREAAAARDETADRWLTAESRHWAGNQIGGQVAVDALWREWEAACERVMRLRGNGLRLSRLWSEAISTLRFLRAQWRATDSDASLANACTSGRNGNAL